MHVCIYSQCVNAFIFALEMRMCIFGLVDKGFGDFLWAKKSPHNGGLCLTHEG